MNNVTTTTGMANETLEQKSVGSLREIATALHLEYTLTDDRDALVKIIQKSDGYNPVNEMGSASEVKEGKKVHPVFGEYIKVTVHPQEGFNQNTAVYVSVNSYTAEFQPRTMVSLPKKIVKFLQEATYAKHVFDANVMSENGNMGAHITRQERAYIVEIAVD